MFNIETEILNLDDLLYDNMQSFIRTIIAFHTRKIDEVSRQEIIEKIYDYFDIVESIENVSFDDITRKYVNHGLSLFKNRIVKNSRAEKYYLRAKEIVYNSKKTKISFEEFKDIIRIIVCFQATTNNQKKSIADFDFGISLEKYMKIRISLIDDIRNKSMNIIDKQKTKRTKKYSIESCYFLLQDITFLLMIGETMKFQVEEKENNDRN